MVERQAVRALLLNREKELLLIKIVEPQSGRAFWVTPGGGIDPGESPEAGLKRELFEETGLKEIEVGPEVWRREHRFIWDGETIHQRERYYLVRTDRFEPTSQHLPDQLEQAVFGGFRWWSIPEIEQSADSFAPRGLGRFLRALIQHGPPHPPLVLKDC